ncbi:hypothetical protein [Streptomyces montanisoli]|uniref:Uncharacterized protein n=1 Tax=Streptomyces montanisoli TaxID=2798581 RepID=A0A940MCA2_9ACTN|nr:hypothetical protein [Streptomyces montanisoli]MBP0458278.1 hypothetical protein [Streptomyces montanisoli]
MAITVSLLLLLAVMTVAFIRSGGLKVWHAVICVLLGFMLASTSMAPTISNGVSATADMVSGIRP